MEIKVIQSELKPEEYNKKVSHPLQTWEWGEAKKSIGNEIHRFTDGKTNYLMTIHNIPHAKYKIGYLPRTRQPSEEIIEYLIDFGEKNRFIYIKMEPYVKKIEFDVSSFGKYKNNIKESPHPLFPKWTMTLDLNKSEDELLKKMKPKTRYNINLAVRKGVKVREVNNEEGFAVFSKLYFETCKRQKYYGHTQEYHQKVWHALKNSIAHILIAELEGEPLAAFELFHFQSGIYYPYGGTSNKYRNLMAANLIMWEAIKLGKKLGAGYFDMWGSLPPAYDEHNDWAGFTRFKEGYGGGHTELAGSYDIIINPILYKTANTLHVIRNWLLANQKIRIT